MTTKRIVPKVSPVRGMPTSTWIDTKTRGWQRDLLYRVVTLMQRAAPKASWSIKWGQPVLEHNGPVAYVRPASTHVTIGFWRGRELDAPLLTGSGAKMAHLKVSSPHELDERALVALVKQAVLRNTVDGDATRRLGRGDRVTNRRGPRALDVATAQVGKKKIAPRSV